MSVKIIIESTVAMSEKYSKKVTLVPPLSMILSAYISDMPLLIIVCFMI